MSLRSWQQAGCHFRRPTNTLKHWRGNCLIVIKQLPVDMLAGWREWHPACKKKLASAISKRVSLEDIWETWSNLEWSSENNSPAKQKLKVVRLLISYEARTWSWECRQLCCCSMHGELCSLHVHPTNSVEEAVLEIALNQTREGLVFVHTAPPPHYLI